MSTPKNTGSATRARNNATKRAEMIEEIEFLLRCNVGEAAILSAVGYTRNPFTLQRRLMRLGRHDLVPRIFEWQAITDERQHPKKAA